jgi:hypothetical protein
MVGGIGEPVIVGVTVVFSAEAIVTSGTVGSVTCLVSWGNADAIETACVPLGGLAHAVKMTNNDRVNNNF